jgi:pimeloyl-ACP methyl ester carboxylesterase
MVPMKRILQLVLMVTVATSGLPTLRADSELTPPKLAVPYGNNPAAGAFADINGIKLHYETYGGGEPLLLIHGNGGSIADLGNQIQFFATRYKVIVADSRGHGRSEMGPGRLTYEQMADDLAALLHQLNLTHVRVLGWSDGGILGLLLAIHHPECVGKLAIMGANLEPDGAYDWALNWVKAEDKRLDEAIAQNGKSAALLAKKQYLDLLGKQPHIPVKDLRKIAAPTLVMAGDKDVIRGEHTLQIFENIPRAHLAIFPGATHMIAWTDPETFNRTVEKFMESPFTRPDTKTLFGM